MILFKWRINNFSFIGFLSFTINKKLYILFHEDGETVSREQY